MYDISIKIFIIDNIILKRATYIVSFGLVSRIVVLAISAAVEFGGVTFHPTLETYQLDDIWGILYQPA